MGTCRVGPRVTEGSWMFIRTDRIAWVAQALLITWKGGYWEDQGKHQHNFLGRIFRFIVEVSVNFGTNMMNKDLFGKEDAFEPAVLNNASWRFLLCCPFEKEDQPGVFFGFYGKGKYEQEIHPKTGLRSANCSLSRLHSSSTWRCKQWSSH